LKCGALFGEGSAWTAVAAPFDEQKPLGLVRSGFALLLIFIGVCFLSLSLALKGSAMGGTIPLILSLVSGVSGCVVVMAKSRKVSKVATAVGALIVAGVVLTINSYVYRNPF
jgi:phosphoglycerol transferase MdoB-like AlkP superfamily enzyme